MGVGCDASAARELEVVSAINSLGFAGEGIRATVERLAERLNPVMRPPSPVNSIDKAQSQLCPVAERIQVETVRIRTADAILCELLDRLEI
jgi:hypothetical protein